MIAIMQPYFMPYLGYIQLMSQADKFIVYDDVNYINRGWVNRNNILVNGRKTLITVPLKGASQNKRINEIFLSGDQKWRSKMLKTVEMSYKKAPYFEGSFGLLEKILKSSEQNLAIFLTNSLMEIADYLGLEVEIIRSTGRFDNEHLKKAKRLIDICKQLGDSDYVNAIGGSEIYTKEEFKAEGINLCFLEMIPENYDQLGNNEFVGYLSILDIMMMKEPTYIKEHLLNKYRLV